MIDKCSDCNKKVDVVKLNQIKNTDKPLLRRKYRWVCETCFLKHKEYQFVGKIKV